MSKSTNLARWTDKRLAAERAYVVGVILRQAASFYNAWLSLVDEEIKRRIDLTKPREQEYLRGYGEAAEYDESQEGATLGGAKGKETDE